jgi:hypothetical protein
MRGGLRRAFAEEWLCTGAGVWYNAGGAPNVGQVADTEQRLARLAAALTRVRNAERRMEWERMARELAQDDRLAEILARRSAMGTTAMGTT